VERAECIVYPPGPNDKEEERIDAIEVSGEVRVKATIPGDFPKVQVKLALPEEFDDFRIHPLCLLN